MTGINLTRRHILIQVGLLLIPLLILLTPHASALPRLSPGDWWSAQGSDQTSISGTGVYDGTFMENDNSSIRFVVTDLSNNTITILEHVDTTFVCTASGNWSCYNPSGEFTTDRQYTVALSNLILTKLTINGNSTTSAIGFPTWVLQDPSLLATSQTAPYRWCFPTSGDTYCSYSEVQASVSTTQLVLKGISEKVYVLTYNGPVLGAFKTNQGIYSAGNGTELQQYDSTYGIWIGAAYHHGAKLIGSDGSWSEAYVESDHFKDSSLTFSAPSTITSSTMSPSSTTSPFSSSGNPLGNIPGFPIESIILGVALAFIFLTLRRSNTHHRRKSP